MAKADTTTDEEKPKKRTRKTPADAASKKSSGKTGENWARGSSQKNVPAPIPMTAMMYQRARNGRSRSNAGSITRIPR